MDQTETIKAETLPIPAQAKLIVVKDQPSLEIANQMFLTIKGLRKKIDDTFSPIISAAHKAHQEAITQRKKIEEPLIEGEKWLNGQVTAYHALVEQKRREEEELARQKAIKEEMERRKQEEEARLAQAAELEAVGAIEEAEALITETVEANEKPVEVYIPPPETPRVKLDGMRITTYWKAEVTDLRALCRAIAEGKQPLAYIEANMTALNKQATSLKKEMNIPGVRAVSDSRPGATGRKAA